MDLCNYSVKGFGNGILDGEVPAMTDFVYNHVDGTLRKQFYFFFC